MRFYEFGEKPSSYYLSLEKSRYDAKTCTVLFDENNQLVKDTKGILNLQRDFYSNLYSSGGVMSFNIQNDLEIVVPEDLQIMMDEEISIEELGKANNAKPFEDCTKSTISC